MENYYAKAIIIADHFSEKKILLSEFRAYNILVK